MGRVGRHHNVHNPCGLMAAAAAEHRGDSGHFWRQFRAENAPPRAAHPPNSGARPRRADGADGNGIARSYQRLSRAPHSAILSIWLAAARSNPRLKERHPLSWHCWLWDHVQISRTVFFFDFEPCQSKMSRAFAWMIAFITNSNTRSGRANETDGSGE
eukprot:gene10589-biopygen4788